MKRSLLFAVLFCIAILLTAQGNYKEGYLIANGGDTIRGWIDFRTSGMNSKECYFKENEKAEVKIFHPGEIEGYRFRNEGKYYVSRNIDVKNEPEKVFAEFMLKGVVNLYYYVGKQDYYFIEDKDGKTTMITQEDEKIIKDYIHGTDRYATKYKTDDKYKGILTLLFHESKSAMTSLKSINFKQNDIIGITKKYHDDVCTNGESCVVFETKKDNKYFSYQFMPYAGLKVTNLTIYQSFPLNHAKEISSLSPIIGVQCNFAIPRWMKSASLNVDISLSRIDGDKEYINPEEQTKKWIYKANVMQLTNRIGGQYTFLKGRFTPTLEAGLNNIFILGDVTSEYIPVRPKENIDSGKMFLGYYLGIGVDYGLKNEHKVRLQLSYENNTGTSEYTMTIDRSKISAFNLKIGYTL